MLTRERVEQAIRVQEKAYAFIHWLRTDGHLSELSYAERHEAMNEVQAADAWLRANRHAISADLLPTPRDRTAFANMLVSFRMTSTGGGWRAPDEACHCRWCGETVWRLGWPTHATAQDRRHARWMKLHGLRDLADEIGLPLLLADLEKLAGRRGELGNAIAWVAYMSELVRRCDYAANRPRYSRTGHGLIVLWRQIAYTHGQLADGFTLTWRRVEQAKALAAQALHAEVQRLMAK